MNTQTALFESSSSLPYANEQHVLTSGAANDWAVWDDWFGLSSRCFICAVVFLEHRQSSPGGALSEKMDYGSG